MDILLEVNTSCRIPCSIDFLLRIFQVKRRLLIFNGSIPLRFHKSWGETEKKLGIQLWRFGIHNSEFELFNFLSRNL